MRRALSLVVLALAGAAATSASAAPPSLEAWAGQANAICAQGQREQKKIPEPKTNAQLASYLEFSFARVRHDIGAVRSLPRPPAVSAEIGRMLGFLQQVIGLEPQLVAAARKGNKAGFARLSAQGQGLTNRANAIARRLGATVCAR